MIETIRPQEIERRSFEIIGEMLQGHPLAPEHECTGTTYLRKTG